MRIRELDAFRGIAVIAVLLFHCSMFRPESDLGFFIGITGVDLFFMISGFVIFMSLDARKSGRTFLISRFIRLYPTYWIIGIITFLLYWILNYLDSPVPFNKISSDTLLVNLSMVQYYFDVPNMSGSYWTLIIELLFYVLIYFIFILKLLPKIVLLGTILNLIIFLLFLTIQFEWIEDYTEFFPLLYHFPLFFIGILFYKIFEDKSLYWKYLILILLSIFLQIYLHPYGRATQFMSIWSYAIMLFLFVGMFSLFIYGKMKFLVNRLTDFLGEISYSLYLIHQPIVYCIVIPYFVDIKGMSYWLVSFGIAIPLAIISAGLITYYVEIPLRRYLRSKLITKK